MIPGNTGSFAMDGMKGPLFLAQLSAFFAASMLVACVYAAHSSGFAFSALSGTVVANEQADQQKCQNRQENITAQMPDIDGDDTANDELYRFYTGAGRWFRCLSRSGVFYGRTDRSLRSEGDGYGFG